MPSLIAGYEYDIFISYRNKDNKYDGWVTDFVANLRKELEATFKEDVSIYFDENPHDGLLETHHVGKSLEGKLKCLIFIPIISQTYCDPRSFAWRHEFLAFNRMATKDGLGKHVKLSNGNVGSRILPIKIHEIDPEDRKLYENETDEILRSIDFIFKSQGVNRPLNINDKRHENLLHTFYRDQINKVANAIKDLLLASQRYHESGEVIEPAMSIERRDEKPRALSRLLISSFRVLRTGTDTEFLAFSLPEAIVGSLSGLKDLSIQMDLGGVFNTMSEFEIETLAQERRLDAAISGSIFQVGDEVRVTATLFELPTVKVMWTKTTQKKVENLFELHDDIVQSIISSLKISLQPSEESDIDNSICRNPEVYSLFLKANQLSLQTNEWDRAREMYVECLNVEPNFAHAWARVARCYRLIGKYAPASEDCARNFAFAESAFDHALRIKPNFDEAHGLMAQLEVDLGRPLHAMKRLLARIKGGSNGPYLFAGLVHCFRWVGLLQDSLNVDHIAKELDPSIMTSVGHTYWMMGEYEKACGYTTADIGYLEGVSLASLGKVDKAIDCLRQNEERTNRETLRSYMRSLRLALEGNRMESLWNLKAACTPGMDAEACYYLLRTYAFLGETEKSMEMIFNAVNKGFSPVGVFQNDPWLAPIRAKPAFEQLMKEASHMHNGAHRIYNDIFPFGLGQDLVMLRKIPA